MCTIIDTPSAIQRSLSQFGPSAPVSWKISELMMPHSGLSMNRNDRMVGIDGTAQGRMNSTDSHRIHGRVFAKKPDRNSASTILTLMAIARNSERVDDGAGEHRIVEQLDVALRIPREPQPVEHRVDDEHREDEHVRRQQQQAPELPGRQAARGGAGRRRRAESPGDRRSWPWLGAADARAHPPHRARAPAAGERAPVRATGQPATCLMRAIISSTAFSTGTFSFSTRFIAFAQTFSLLTIVNL